MNCHVCVNAEHPGGPRYYVRPAVGVCQGCGAGVCEQHARKTKA